MSEFKKHLIFKIFTNLVKIPVNLILNALFPRLLGAINYGNFDFLNDSANKVIGFFDTGTSIAFYTRLSQNNQDNFLIKFYWWIVSILVFAYFIFIFGSGIFNFTQYLWPNQSFYFVLLSAILGILTFISSTIILIMDASNLTVRSEKIRMAQLLISLFIFSFISIFFKKINLEFFFYAQFLIIIFLIVGCCTVLYKKKISIYTNERITRSLRLNYSLYFWKFSNPLLVYSAISLIVGIGSRWILQQYGGAIQQAYFGLASKIGSFVLLFTTALMPLLMREFSKLYGKNDFISLSRLYVLSFKGLYFISLLISIIVFFNADFISTMLGGLEFKKSTIVLSIMAFYPIHQSLGQINGSIIYSTQRNKEYRNVGILLMPLGLILAFFLIAPIEFYGLNLGAKGLAIQMLLIQILIVNANTYLNCRYLNISFIRLFFYQISLPIIFLIIGYFFNELLSIYIYYKFIKFIIFGIMISLSAGLIIYIYPKIIGFEKREQILHLFEFNSKSRISVNLIHKK